MAKKLVAVVGEYTNQQGEQKAEFCDIGVINVSQNGKEYALIDPTVNIAGVLAKQNVLAAKRGEELRDMVMCSVFERDNQQQAPSQGGYQQAPAQGGYQQPAQQQGYQQPAPPPQGQPQGTYQR